MVSSYSIMAMEVPNFQVKVARIIRGEPLLCLAKSWSATDYLPDYSAQFFEVR